MMKKALFVFVLFVIGIGSVQAQSKRSISILGDSYSTFKDYLQPDTNYVWYPQENKNVNDVADVSQTWWHQLIRNNDFRLCVNNSFSGATICNTGYEREDYSDRSYCTRLKYLGSPDIIIVFGGTNDTWAKSPLGDFKYAEWTRRDLYKFRPAMAYLLHHLKNHYPGVDIYVVINDILSEDITYAMKTICDYYQINYISLHDIDKQSGHPSIKGMEQIARQVAERIH